VHLHFELWEDGRPRDPLEKVQEAREEESEEGYISVSHQDKLPPTNAQGRRPSGRRP
jgi:murein DD-endopeptidase MepM/ murein hydrolase activator NlpD